LTNDRVFATGGIGGVHFGSQESGDISADLVALARYPVAVVVDLVHRVVRQPLRLPGAIAGRARTRANHMPSGRRLDLHRKRDEPRPESRIPPGVAGDEHAGRHQRARRFPEPARVLLLLVGERGPEHPGVFEREDAIGRRPAQAIASGGHALDLRRCPGDRQSFAQRELESAAPGRHRDAVGYRDTAGAGFEDGPQFVANRGWRCRLRRQGPRQGNADERRDREGNGPMRATWHVVSLNKRGNAKRQE
jgi:hypothetical protein